MNRADLREIAKSLVDGDFSDEQWNKWLNIGINVMSNAVNGVFRRRVQLTLVNGEVKIPDYVVAIKELNYLSDGKWLPVTYYPNSDIRYAEEKYYYTEDKKIKCPWATDETIEIHAECAASAMSNDAASPDFVAPEFQDVIAVYAAMLSQIYDDEHEKYKDLSEIHNARMSMYISKATRTTSGGKRSFGFVNGVIRNGR